VPNGGEPYGWLGRVADAIDPELTPNFLVNIDERQSLAVRAARHVPVVFDDPERFMRKGLNQSRAVLDSGSETQSDNPSQRFLDEVAQSAKQASQRVRAAWDKLQDAGGLRHHRTRSAQGGSNDRRRSANAAVSRRVPAQCF
jgi:hypothetical protein